MVFVECLGKHKTDFPSGSSRRYEDFGTTNERRKDSMKQINTTN